MLCVFSTENRQLSAFTTHSLFTLEGGGSVRVCVHAGGQRTAVSGCAQCRKTSALPNYIQVKLQQDVGTVLRAQRDANPECVITVSGVGWQRPLDAAGYSTCWATWRWQLNQDGTHKQNKWCSDSLEQCPLWKSKSWGWTEQRPRDWNGKWKSKRGIKEWQNVPHCESRYGQRMNEKWWKNKTVWVSFICTLLPMHF